jgi:hypothetical protein
MKTEWKENRGRKEKYPMSSLKKVGDRVYIYFGIADKKSRSIKSACYQRAKDLKIKIRTCQYYGEIIVERIK